MHVPSSAASTTTSDSDAAASSVTSSLNATGVSSAEEHNDYSSSMSTHRRESAQDPATSSAVGIASSASEPTPTRTSATRYIFTESQPGASTSTLSAVQALVTSQVIRIVSPTSSIEFSYVSLNSSNVGVTLPVAHFSAQKWRGHFDTVE